MIASPGVESKMPTDECDVLIIGGGIHGVGVAQASAAAGYGTTLVEQRELAYGTSSRSSKLIHGGLRYLEGGHLRLVRESLRERELLIRLAPQLVKRQRFFIPMYESTSRRPLTIRCGLSLYAVLAGGKRSCRFRSVPRRDWDQLDGLQTAGLKKVFQYWDAQTDDRLLTEAVMRSAMDLGARLICPGEFQRAERQTDSYLVTLVHDGAELTIQAKVVINAAGPWANRILDQVTPSQDALAVDLVQGSHIELPGRVEQGCYYLEVAQDHRAVFVMPWQDRTLVGTTERKFEGDPADVEATSDEVDYLTSLYEKHFPGKSTELLAKWAGLRVLPSTQGGAFRASRETQLPVDDPGQPRLVSIFGGKLTGYRATACRVMRVIAPSLPDVSPIADTAEIPLSHPDG